jgi:pimeloyl-ACP methyl ester carboxylesterase
MTADYVVTSVDGTRIAAARSGSGSPLILVHGAIGDRTSFRYVEPLLAANHTVVVMDRRGHGQSGDSSSAFAIEQEFDDVAALADSFDSPIDLLGHSYGATVALGAAARIANLRRLVLYEPSPGIVAASAAFVARLEDLVARGERESALALALTEFAGFGSDDLEQYRASPLWAPRVAAAHTIAREIRAEEAWVPTFESVGRLDKPVMLLLGSESPAWARQGADAVAAVVAESRMVVLDGQGHMATVTAPELLAAEVERFLA